MASDSRRALAVVVVAIGLVFGLRAIGDAHAALVSSEPASRSHLASSPTHVRLVFSEPVEPTLATLSLAARDGRITPLSVRGDPRDVHALVAPIPDRRQGAFRLFWRVVSVDGHPVDGSFAFWVGTPSAIAPPAGNVDGRRYDSTWGPAVIGAPIIPAALRALAVGCVMALGGVLLFASWSTGDGESGSRAPLRLARTLAIAAPAMLALHLAAWTMNVAPDHRLTRDAISAAVVSSVGRVELWRLGFALLAFWALWLARRTRLALVFTIAALVVSGATGHSMAIDPRWAVPARALHLLAASAWLGGLLWLLTSEPTDGPLLARTASRVSSVALSAVLIVAFSGIVQARLFLDSPGDLVHSPYGLLMLAKIAGFVVLIAFGVHHRYRVLPHLPKATALPGRFALTLRREVAMMILVALLGGWLAYVPAPRTADVHTASTHDSPE
jgi:copper transport protein